MSNITDPYQILGVSPNATDDEVKKAYIKGKCRSSAENGGRTGC